MHLLQSLAARLAPPVCALCGAPGQSTRDNPQFDLCACCEAACQRLEHPCPRCALPLPTRTRHTAAAPCPACHHAPPPFDRAICALRYADPVDRMVTALKFDHDLAFARVLGALLARAVAAAAGPRPACLIPLPTHPTRYRERGFCQTREIARHLARGLRDTGPRVPLRTDLLQRVRATRAQSGLAAGERALNLRDAFTTTPGTTMPRHVAVLDDVMTTGHTVAAAALALRRAGVSRIEIWCCARTLPGAGGAGPTEVPGPIC